jgi:hypothetical protein
MALTVTESDPQRFTESAVMLTVGNTELITFKTTELELAGLGEAQLKEDVITALMVSLFCAVFNTRVSAERGAGNRTLFLNQLIDLPLPPLMVFAVTITGDPLQNCEAVLIEIDAGKEFLTLTILLNVSPGQLPLNNATLMEKSEEAAVILRVESFPDAVAPVIVQTY